VRGVRRVELEPELADAERLREPRCGDERGQARREPLFGRYIDRQ
jgi:hypothetical protein